MAFTFYCACFLCCGWNSGGPTASGAMPRAGVTCAHATLPFGTRVLTPVGWRTVQDRCKPKGTVDVYVNDHRSAIRRGKMTSPNKFSSVSSVSSVVTK